MGVVGDLAEPLHLDPAVGAGPRTIAEVATQGVPGEPDAARGPAAAEGERQGAVGHRLAPILPPLGGRQLAGIGFRGVGLRGLAHGPQVIKIRYGAFFTRYARCPKCRFATKSETVQRIRSPTTRSTGLEQIDERCAQCGYHARSNRVVPRLDDSSSSSGSSRGGGSSSGAGASGSW